jgi:hypothetical protein
MIKISINSLKKTVCCMLIVVFWDLDNEVFKDEILVLSQMYLMTNSTSQPH